MNSTGYPEFELPIRARQKLYPLFYYILFIIIIISLHQKNVFGKMTFGSHTLISSLIIANELETEVSLIIYTTDQRFFCYFHGRSRTPRQLNL